MYIAEYVLLGPKRYEVSVGDPCRHIWELSQWRIVIWKGEDLRVDFQRPDINMH